MPNTGTEGWLLLPPRSGLGVVVAVLEVEKTGVDVLLPVLNNELVPVVGVVVGLTPVADVPGV